MQGNALGDTVMTKKDSASSFTGLKTDKITESDRCYVENRYDMVLVL